MCLSTLAWGGYPVPGLGGGYTPFQVWVGGTSSHVWWGVPHPRSGWGVLYSADGWYPIQDQTRRGYPPSKTGWGTPPISKASTCYAAGGVPLAFTQDFLVIIILCFLGCIHTGTCNHSIYSSVRKFFSTRLQYRCAKLAIRSKLKK